jgi:hypothetical protein
VGALVIVAHTMFPLEFTALPALVRGVAPETPSAFTIYGLWATAQHIKS